VTANFRNRISMERNEKSCHGVKVPPFFLVVGGEGGLFFSSCFGVESGLSVHCSHSTWTLDSRLSMPVWGGVQIKEFPMSSSFHLCRWAKGEDHYNSK
jgi:hypothetical protein